MAKVAANFAAVQIAVVSAAGFGAVINRKICKLPVAAIDGGNPDMGKLKLFYLGDCG